MLLRLCYFTWHDITQIVSGVFGEEGVRYLLIVTWCQIALYCAWCAVTEGEYAAQYGQCGKGMFMAASSHLQRCDLC